MSKIYNKYIELKTKEKSNHILYLFKYGIFFIFIDNDARIASQLLHLKLSQLNDSIVKCGFPVNSLSKYTNLLNTTSYRIEVVDMSSSSPLPSSDYIYFENLKHIFNEFLELNIDNLSISQAYDVLYKIKNKLINLNKEIYNEEKK